MFWSSTSRVTYSSTLLLHHFEVCFDMIALTGKELHLLLWAVILGLGLV